MGGKASILLVLGFSLIFLVAGTNFWNLSTRSVENNIDYFANGKAHNIAVSGANIALQSIFQDKDWDDGISGLSFDGGEINVSVVSDSAFKIVTSSGTFEGIEHEVIVKLQPSSYAKFAWYAGNMSSKDFITGDTVWGPFHTQSKLNIDGDPVFWGKVTSLKGLNIADGDPKFYGGYESGIDVPLPVNYQFTQEKSMAVDGVVNKGGSSYFDGTDVWLTFNSDGTITHRTGTGSDSSTYSAPITEPLSTFAPNGVIYIARGNIYASGTLNGKVTVAVGEASGVGHGNLYLVDNLTYRNAPMVYDAALNKYVKNESCQDMLGLLATNNVVVAETDKNVFQKDVRIDASIFCAQGGFTIEDKTIPPSGTIYVRGGMVAAKEELVATIDNSGNIKNGYKKHVIFDERFMLNIPPVFPGTGKFEIVSWFE
jgi:hypothetical protein